MTVKFSFGNSGDENNNCYKYHIDEDKDTIETMIERVQSVKGVKRCRACRSCTCRTCKNNTFALSKRSLKKSNRFTQSKNPVERLKVVRVEPVKVGVHNQKRVEPVEPVECDEEYQLVQQTQRLNLTTTP